MAAGFTQSGQLRLKISVCDDIKYMNYTIHEEKKRMVFDKIQHFPLEVCHHLPQSLLLYITGVVTRRH